MVKRLAKNYFDSDCVDVVDSKSNGVVGVCRSGAMSFIYEVVCESDFISTSNEFKSFVDACELSLKTYSPSIMEDAEVKVFNSTREKCYLKRSKKLVGNVYSYVHHNKKTATLVSLENEDKDIGHLIAMELSAMNMPYQSIIECELASRPGIKIKDVIGNNKIKDFVKFKLGEEV